MATRSGIALAALALAGCPAQRAAPSPDPCAGGAPGRLELREGQGALELALRPLPDGKGAVLCDAAGRTLGRLGGAAGPGSDAGAALPADTAAATTLRGPGGEVQAAIVLAPGDDPLIRIGPRRAIRLHDEQGLIRLLDEQGVPIGQVGQQEARAIVYDPAGRPLATAERAEPGEERRVVRGPDGAVRHLLLGLRDDRAAAVFGLDALRPPEQLLLALFLDGRSAPRPGRDGGP